MNLYEIHSHTKETSPCGWVEGQEVARLHKKEGFKGICITDHYYEGFFDIHHGRSNRYIVSQFLHGYHQAKEEGDKIGLNVLLGIELRFLENLNDYLVYGIDEAFLYESPLIYKMTLKEFKKFIEPTEIMLVFAHPFRSVITMMEPSLFEAVEIFNGNLRQDSRNSLAKAFGEMHNLIGTCGSDFHRKEDINLSSMEFNDDIKNELQLVRAIRNRQFRHKINRLE